MHAWQDVLARRKHRVKQPTGPDMDVAVDSQQRSEDVEGESDEEATRAGVVLPREWRAALVGSVRRRR